MRRKYIKSHYPLSITLSIVFISTIAFSKTKSNERSKEKPNETNIVCFAAKNQWVCAPEDQQEIANEKAKKLLIKKDSELVTSDVVIKSINIPKFDTPISIEPEPLISSTTADNKTTSKVPSNPNKEKTDLEAAQLKHNINPYAELWSHQLIGVSTPRSATNFVKKHNLNKDDILIIQSVRNGMDWWIILFGLYQDKKTGLNNEINLPPNINKPWLRPLKNLQVNGFIEKF
ncbi:MAG: hypothetical protein L3J83_10315 [Proteobacteria bacterium]|nr:hypothetical protein [Pseudomonadota bacterium]